MTERLRSASTVGYHCPKMENDLSPRKTMVVLVIVVGCFAVLWPKVFYPMLVGSANQHIKPSPIDKTTGCCDVISETDVNTIKIMTELCGTIINATEDKPLTGKEIVQRCRQEVLDTCGIDISVVLQEQVRLGQSVKQILDEIRSLNGSLCLKYNYGVAPWRLGVPHRITVKSASDASNIRQERPIHLRSELVHPAFRERGRAIPQPQVAAPSRPPPRIVEGRPGPIPGMRPTIGGAGHVVPPSKQGTSSMSVIMPIYTIGIVIFFTYTLMKIIFKKQPDSVGGSLYPQVDPDPHFRKEVFESESSRLGPRLTRENISSKLVVNAMSALLDEVDQEIEARRKSSEVASQDLVNGTLSNGNAVKPQDEEQPTVKVLGMEMTASCEGGKKWSRAESPVLPTSPPPPAEPAPPPQEIYLEGALPAQSHLLVADSAIEPEPTSGEDPAVVLSGKMTLSVISLDSENGVEETVDDTEDITEEKGTSNGLGIQETNVKSIEEVPSRLEDETEQPLTELEEITKEPHELVREEETTPTSIHESTIKLVEEILKEEDAPLTTEETSFNIEEETEKLLANLGNESTQSSVLEKDIEEFLQKLREQSDFETPIITLESEDAPHTLEVESLEKEVDDLIQEAIDSVQHKVVKTELLPTLSEPTNEIRDDVNQIKTEEQTLSQVSNDALEIEKKLELKQEISNEIEKLIQEVKELPVVEQKFQDEKQNEKIIEENTSQIEEKLNVDVEKLKVAEETQALSNKVDEISHRIEEITSRIGEAAESQLEEIDEAISEKGPEEVAAEGSILPTSDVSIQPETETKLLDEKIEPTATKVEEKISSTNEDVIQETTTEATVDKVEENLSSNSEPTAKVDVEAIAAAKPSDHEIILNVSKTEENKSEDEEAILKKIDDASSKKEPDVSKQSETETKPLDEKIEPTITEVEEKISITNEDSVQGTATEATVAKLEENLTSNSELITKVNVEEKIEKAEVEAIAAVKPSDNEIILEVSKTEENKFEDEEAILKKDVTEIENASSKKEPEDVFKQPETETKRLDEKIEPATTKVEEKISSNNEDILQETVIEGKVEEKKKSEPAAKVDVEQNIEKVEVEAVAAKPSSNETEVLKVSKTEENKSKSDESEDEELGSDEELVEEIEEIVYEEESGEEEVEEEEIEIEVEEESEEEIPYERNTNRTESSSAPRVNGERSEDLVEESKYTTVSGATAAENEISDEDLIDNEEVEEEEEEIIEVEEEVEEEEYVNEEGNDVNHVSGESEPEL